MRLVEVRAVRPGVSIVVDKVAQLGKAVEALIGSRVGVGVPESATARDGDVTNAALLYIHDNGAPEAHIPARPSLMPGIKRVQGQVEKRLRRAAEAALRGDLGAIDRNLAAVGQEAASSVQNVIREGIPPPLADSTLRGRLRRHKGRKGERAELERRAAGGIPQVSGNVTPLIDTGRLIQHITYAVRKAPKR